MANINLSHPNWGILTTDTFVSKESLEKEINSIKKEYNRFKKIQKAKNWKHNLTK